MSKKKDVARAQAGKPFRNQEAPPEQMGQCTMCGHYLPQSKWEAHKKECKGRPE